VDDFYLQQERNAFFIPNVHYRVPRKVDPVRISHTVKKNMLKENAMYEKSAADANSLDAANDVALLSKDMEVNFSNKNDFDDDDDKGMTPSDMIDGVARLIKADSMDIIDDSELKGVVQGVAGVEEMKIGDKVKILEEQKDHKKNGALAAGNNVKQTPGRSKLQNNNIAEPKV